jgi:hypothetical protein
MVPSSNVSLTIDTFLWFIHMICPFFTSVLYKTDALKRYVKKLSCPAYFYTNTQNAPGFIKHYKSGGVLLINYYNL